MDEQMYQRLLQVAKEANDELKEQIAILQDRLTGQTVLAQKRAEATTEASSVAVFWFEQYYECKTKLEALQAVSKND